ncbi:hypothetical protein BPJM79_10787 [Bacillus pumilus]
MWFFYISFHHMIAPLFIHDQLYIVCQVIRTTKNWLFSPLAASNSLELHHNETPNPLFHEKTAIQLCSNSALFKSLTLTHF